MLDAHQSIAMSYEVYERNLFTSHGDPIIPGDFADELEKHKQADSPSTIRQLTDPNLRVLLFRALRSGLTVSEIVEELRDSGQKKDVFHDQHGRLDFIDRLMKRKMMKQGKIFWGGKTEASLYELHQRHPGAIFFIMVRDIRDVYASMINNGQFPHSAVEAAELWETRILRFREFVRRRNPKSMEVHYEELVREPSKVLGSVCNLVGLEPDEDMIHFHEKNLSLLQNPFGHLSSEQIKRGLNTSSVGRWKQDLTREQARLLSVVNEKVFGWNAI